MTLKDTIESILGRGEPEDHDDEIDRAPIEPEVLLGLVQDPRRWTILSLVEENGAISIRDLTDRMTVVEKGPQYGSQDRKAVYVSLYQTHLPRLTDTDVLVEWDSEMGVMYRPGPCFDVCIDVMTYTFERTM